MPITLTDRLRQVITTAVPRVTAETMPTLGDDRPRAVHRPIARVDSARVAQVLGGQASESTEGTVVVVDRYFAADRRHGRATIGDVVRTLDAGGEALDVLTRAWPGRLASDDPTAQIPSFSLRRLCFFDLETTGIAGGAGTQAFLVGCAIPEDGGLRVRQFLLPGFEHERALLAMVAAWTAAQGSLVSFNGRSFDVPLIETRYLLHRLSFPLGELPHLDMLHPARRLWKERPTIAGPALDDDRCSLAVLERHLAGYHRVGDVPAFEIPSRYFRFVRDGNAYPLEAVLEHNRSDLISLALVTARVLRLIQSGPAAATHARESLGLGRLYERIGATDNAETCYERAAALAGRVGREPDVPAEALRRLALSRRRAGRIADAAAAWQSLLAVPGCPSRLRHEATEALAIHHEHRSRDLQAARAMVLDLLVDSWSANRDRAAYRLARIDRKLARDRHPSLPMDLN